MKKLLAASSDLVYYSHKDTLANQVYPLYKTIQVAPKPRSKFIMVLKLNEASCAGMASTVAPPSELDSAEMLAETDFQSANYSKSTLERVESPEQTRIDLYSAKELADEKEFTDKLTPQDLATRAARMINKISPHEAIKTSNHTVALTLNFTKPHFF
jgi:hypothetical protein